LSIWLLLVGVEVDLLWLVVVVLVDIEPVQPCPWSLELLIR
jgi:hypothetical protein